MSLDEYCFKIDLISMIIVFLIFWLDYHKDTKMEEKSMSYWDHFKIDPERDKYPVLDDDSLYQFEKHEKTETNSTTNYTIYVSLIDEKTQKKEIRKHTRIYQKVKMTKAMEERSHWEKFGKAKGTDGFSNTTIANDEYFMLTAPDLRRKYSSYCREYCPESPTYVDEEKETPKITKFVTCSKCKGAHFTKDCSNREEPKEESPVQQNKSGAYVPPNKRKSSSNYDNSYNSENTTIRLTEIVTDALQDDVRELASKIGNVTRIHMCKHRDDRFGVTGEFTGTAFVSFVDEETAKLAVERLNGHRYSYLTLQAEMSKPRNSSKTSNKNSNNRYSGR